MRVITLMAATAVLATPAFAQAPPASQAQLDHGIATQDHGIAGGDHTVAKTDHVDAQGDRREAAEDRSDAADDRKSAAENRTRAGQDHAVAGADNARAGSDHVTATADHGRADKDHDKYLLRPPPHQEVILSGSGTLYEGRDRRRQVDPRTGKRLDNPITLSEQLDGCLYPNEGVAFDRDRDTFGCVALTARGAARHYRVLSGRRSWEAEGFTSEATLGFTGLGLSVGHAAKNTVAAWTALGLLPVVADDVSAPGPRAKLYNIGATAMTVMIVRAETLRAALKETDSRILKTGATQTLEQEVQAACDDAALDRLDALTLPDGLGTADAAALKKARDKFTAALRNRCDDFTAATQKLSAASGAWNFGGKAAARNLAGDAVILDDAITRLDRQTLAPARGALTVIVGSLLTLPGKLVSGTTPPEYTGRSLEVFRSSYTFNLARAPDAEVPAPIGANVSAPEGFNGPNKELPLTARRFNVLSAEINQSIAAAAYFKALNDRSILTVSPGIDQPVTLTAPPKT